MLQDRFRGSDNGKESEDDMPNIPQIKIGGTTYDIKDKYAQYSETQDGQVIFDKSILDSAYEIRSNVDSSGLYSFRFKKAFPAGIYTVIYRMTSSTAHEPQIRFSSSPNKYTYITGSGHNITLGTTIAYAIRVEEDFYGIFVFSGNSSADSAGKTLNVSRLEVYAGIHLPKNEDIDLTNLMNAALTEYGVCNLENGVYKCSALAMPAGSALRGVTGTIIENYLTPGAKTVTLSQKTENTYTSYDLSSYNLNPGLYEITINITSAAETSVSRVCLLNALTYGAGKVMSSNNVARDIDVTFIAAANAPVMAIGIFGGTSTTTVGEFTINKLKIVYKGIYAVSPSENCSIQDIIFRGNSEDINLSDSLGFISGVVWSGPDKYFAVVTRCRFMNFDNSGIVLISSGTPVDKGIIISDCFIKGNNIGINIIMDSEYNKITNCIIARNYYGVINRGGNNIISNSGIDSNVVGMKIDNENGSNGGHGSVSNCTFNHSNDNEGYGLIISGTGRMLIGNCNFYYSKTKLENTNGNVISNCGYGNAAPIEIVGGQANMIVGCMMKSLEDTPITVNNNESTIVKDCYTRSGEQIMPQIAS